jgi:hypothetical protein
VQNLIPRFSQFMKRFKANWHSEYVAQGCVIKIPP